MHAHSWQLVNAALRRYRCVDPTCNAIGYARVGRRGILPYLCQYELDGRTHCGKPAVAVGALRTQRRCAEHAHHVPASSAAPAA